MLSRRRPSVEKYDGFTTPTAENVYLGSNSIGIMGALTSLERKGKPLLTITPVAALV